MINFLQSKKYIITIVLAVAAIAIEVYYSICGGACSYLKGSLFGIELQYIGIAYMVCIIILALLKQDRELLILLSAGVGIEFYLIGFQIWFDTYCSYCLAFAAIIFILFLVHFSKKRTVLCIASVVVALVLFSLFFKGSAKPSYSYSWHSFHGEKSFCMSSEILIP